MVDPRFWGLWKQKLWCNGVDRIIVDEFHCIDDWGGCRGEGFRPEFIELNRLVIILKNRTRKIPWLLASASADENAISRILHQLEMPPFQTTPHKDRTLWVARSNDRPNLHLSDPRPRKFIVYCNSRSDTQRAATYRNSGPEKFRDGEWFGMVCTDALGLVRKCL